MSSTQDGTQSSGSNTNTPATTSSTTTTTPQSSVSVPAMSSGAGSGGGGATASNMSSDDNLVCRWSDCSERFTSAENLYDHICERHVGRKSTNNLNLTCQWNQCRTTTVKRDHITSHIRVHVPLKPHKCDFCGKTFKRPQDLKKHVKTHADDSVLQGRPGQDPAGGGLMAAYRTDGAPGYYDHHGNMRANPSAFQSHAGGGGHGNYYTTHSQQQQQQPYGGGLFFPPALNPRSDGYIGGYHHQQHQQHQQQPQQPQQNHAAPGPSNSGFVQRRSLDVLNELFGSLKRGDVDPSSYSQVGRSLLLLQTGIGGGGHGGHGGSGGGDSVATDYMRQPPHLLAASTPHNAMAQHYYLPPIPNLRTKSDLEDMDALLEQMQMTIYDNSGSSPTPNVQHAFDLRHGHSATMASPLVRPNAAHDHFSAAAAAAAVAAAAVTANAHMASPLTTLSQSGGSPAVTPPSSGTSYTSGHSPSASSTGMSPPSQQAPGGGGGGSGGSGGGAIAYPQLPSSSGVAFPGAPAPATLGSSFGPDDREHRGGMLHSASRKVKMEPSGPATSGLVSQQEDEGARRGRTSSMTASSPSAASDTSGGSEPESYDQWLNNVRIIESLREYVKTRLTQLEYDASDRGSSLAAAAGGHERRPGRDTHELPDPPTTVRLPPLPPSPAYPMLRMVAD